MRRKRRRRDRDRQRETSAWKQKGSDPHLSPSTSLTAAKPHLLKVPQPPKTTMRNQWGLFTLSLNNVFPLQRILQAYLNFYQKKNSEGSLASSNSWEYWLSMDGACGILTTKTSSGEYWLCRVGCGRQWCAVQCLSVWILPQGCWFDLSGICISTRDSTLMWFMMQRLKGLHWNLSCRILGMSPNFSQTPDSTPEKAGL